MRRAVSYALIIASLIGYTYFAWKFPLLPAYSQIPLSDVASFAPSLREAFVYATIITGLFLLLWALVREIRRGRLTLKWWHAAGVTALFATPLLFTYPINANDVFRYFQQGRMTIHYGENPLDTRLNTFPDDPYLPLAGEWAGETSPYGPVWEIVDAAVYLIGFGGLFNSLILFKLAGLLLHLACGWLIWLLLAAALPRMRLARTVLWLWNPALLLLFVVDAHNDVLMLFWLLLGYWLMLRGRLTVGMIVMVLAPLTKLIAVLALPFFFIKAWLQLDWSGRARFVAGSVIGALIVSVLAFLPFGSPLPLLERLLRESGNGGGFSMPAVVILAGRAFYLDPPAQLILILFQVAFVVMSLVLVVMALRGRSALRGSADIFASYLLTAFKFRIWYPSWLVPWVILDMSSRRRLNAVMAFLLTSQLSVVIYGHMRNLVFGNEPGPVHFIGVPFVFGIPLLVLLIPTRQGQEELTDD
jgi:hypothetical protein